MADATRVSAPPDETALIRAIARGDEDAMETLYRAHADGLLRFIYRRVNENYEDAQEVTQDTFLSAIEMAATFRGECSVLVWLCGIARLRIVDLYRRQSRDKRAPREMAVELHEDIAADSDTAADVEDQFAAAQLVDQLALVLSEEEREAFMLRHVEGFALEEVATVLKRSERAAEGLVYRAKQKLRTALVEGRVQA